ncbi:MAG TPA: tetratricopeptide repeat protein [Ktedonobacterales bacterium]|nr:tetratricopeptide repeat protein [Ktedonobacterales bacterium]
MRAKKWHTLEAPVVPTHATPPSDFAALLRRFRLARGLSQEELAARAGVSVTSVSYLERGLTRLPHKDTLQLLITALELAPDDAAILVRAARRARSIAVDTAPAIPTEAPPPPPPSEQSSLTMPSYRLSPPLTPLLGREHDEASVVHLLAQERVRLLTLTGPAGVGKTRLALQVAGALRDQHGFEVALVDLVASRAADHVPRTIAQTLGVRQTGDLSLLDAMTAAVGDRRLLLVLDNFEHVLSAAPLCAALLGACPNAKALVTSRAALNIRGEHEFAVPPLGVPDLAGLPPIADLERFGAVALFVERARAARPEFALGTPERGQLVASICARLDGLPLAIELAASQVRRLTLADLAERLQGSAPLDLLVGGPRDLADHQRAMRSTVAWSYSLLSAPEQRVFRTLGVFAGGATIDGMRTVASLSEGDAVASLTSLVDASLARRVDRPGDPSDEARYDMLVVVRAVAVERLREAGELEATRRGLVDYIEGLIEPLNPSAFNVQTAELNRLVREHDNLRAALDWLLEYGETRIAVRLAARLRAFWEQRGLISEGATWLERLLARMEPPQTADDLDKQVDAWKVLVVMRHRLCQFQQAVEAAERVLALTRQQGDAGKVGRALHYLANPLAHLGEYERAEEMLVESLALNRAEGDKTSEMISLINLGDLRCYQGHYDEALAADEEALTLSRSLGEQEPSLALILANMGETYIMMDRPAEARSVLLESQRVVEAYDQPTYLALYNLGRACWRLGASSEALSHLERALWLTRQQDDIAALVQALCVVAGVALDQGDLVLARQTMDEAIGAQIRVSDQRVRWRVVERTAAYVCRLGDWKTTTRLYAAAEQGRPITRDLVDPAERDLRERDRAAALHALAPDVFAALEMAGRSLPLNVALELARVVLANPGTA